MKTYFFVFVLPVVWIIVSFVSYYHPGDEYAMYAISNIIGVWPFFLFQPPDVHGLLFPCLVAVIGGLTIALAGFGLDKLKSNRWVWGLCWIVFSALFFAFAILQYPTIKNALAKNGSWTAYIASALNLGLYGSIIVSAIVGTIVLVIKQAKKYRIKEPKQ